MIQSFYTLRLLAAELDSSLTGRLAGQSFSQSRSELVIPFLSDDHSASSVVRFSIGKQRYCFEDARYARAKRNVAELFDRAEGKRVASVTIADRDRCLLISLEDDWLIALALTGASANAYLVNENGVIVEAFSDNDELHGQLFNHTRPAPDFPPLEEWGERLASRLSSGKVLSGAVSASYAFFDRSIGREVVRRAGIADTEGALSKEQMALLHRVAAEVELELLEQPTPTAYRDRAATWKLSLYKPEASGIDIESVRELSSVNAAVRTVLINGWREEGFTTRVGPVRSRLEKLLGDRERALDGLRKGLARPSRSEQYQKWGDLLMAWQGSVDQSKESVDIPDYYGAGETAAIPVVAGHSRTELAQHYYTKARKSRKRRETDEVREQELASEVHRIRQVYEDAVAIDSHDGWDSFERRHGSTLAELMPSRAGGQETLPFRSYALSDGYMVYVGRNATQNDKLTTSYARKEDLWLHARGVPGSHTVLRVKGREDPPTNIVEAAASIAAYHSKARGSALVPVIVVKKKYVRKPKGAQKGTVTVDRENVILVEPKLPVK